LHQFDLWISEFFWLFRHFAEKLHVCFRAFCGRRQRQNEATVSDTFKDAIIGLASVERPWRAGLATASERSERI